MTNRRRSATTRSVRAQTPEQLLELTQEHIRPLIGVIDRLNEVGAEDELRVISKQLTRLVFRAQPLPRAASSPKNRSAPHRADTLIRTGLVSRGWVWVEFYFRSHSRLRCSRLPPLRPRHFCIRRSYARLSARAPLVGVAASLSAKPR
jgi:hypothetical protein